MPVPWKLWEGQVLDLNLPLHRYLGGTGRSAVFLTQYGDPPANAAVKLVAALEQDAELLSQWERATQLSHPNLLRLLRRGSCVLNQRQLDYVVTEYAQENLAEALTERALSSEEVRDMLEPLLGALAYIHGEGLVHGHVKPSNIMAVDDTLKLSVDGISRVGDLADSPSPATPYDPPELAERGPSPIGDVWSFGMTLVEALTQKLPKQNNLKQDPALPEGLPAEFLPLVRACLRADPRKRTPLDGILTLWRQPAEALPAPAAAEAPKPPRKSRNLVMASAAALALAAILVPRLTHKSPSEDPAGPPAVSSAPSPEVAKPEIRQSVAPPVPAVENPAPATAPPTSPTAPGLVAAATPSRNAHMMAKPEKVVHQVLPDITEQARRSIRGKVTIKVRATIDPSGHVTDAKVESQNSRYFAGLTMDAVRQWGFVPEEAPTEWLLRFEYTAKGTDVYPAQVSR